MSALLLLVVVSVARAACHGARRRTRCTAPAPPSTSLPHGSCVTDARRCVVRQRRCTLVVCIPRCFFVWLRCGGGGGGAVSSESRAPCACLSSPLLASSPALVAAPQGPLSVTPPTTTMTSYSIHVNVRRTLLPVLAVVATTVLSRGVGAVHAMSTRRRCPRSQPRSLRPPFDLCMSLL